MKQYLILLFLLPITAQAQNANQIKSRKITEVVTTIVSETDDAENRKIHEIYDRRGRLTDRKVYRKDGTLRFHKTIEYLDKKGSFVETIFNIENGKTKTSTTTFDKWGNDISFIRKDEAGLLQERRTKTFDKQGKIILDETFGPKEELMKKTTYQYDFRDMLLQKETRDGSGKIIESIQNEYVY